MAGAQEEGEGVHSLKRTFFLGGGGYFLKNSTLEGGKFFVELFHKLNNNTTPPPPPKRTEKGIKVHICTIEKDLFSLQKYIISLCLLCAVADPVLVTQEFK